MEFLLQLIADFFGGEVLEAPESIAKENLNTIEEEMLKHTEEEVVTEEPNLFNLIMFR